MEHVLLPDQDLAHLGLEGPKALLKSRHLVGYLLGCHDVLLNRCRSRKIPEIYSELQAGNPRKAQSALTAIPKQIWRA